MLGQAELKMNIILPQLPDIKDGQIDPEELRRFLFALQLIIDQIAKAIT